MESVDGVPESSDVTVTPASTPESTTTPGELVPGTVGPPPTWVVSDAEWIASELEPVIDPGLATVTLVAGPAGVAASWVAIVDGVSDPLVAVGGLATEPSSGSADAIIAWRTDPALGNAIVRRVVSQRPTLDPCSTRSAPAPHSRRASRCFPKMRACWPSNV